MYALCTATENLIADQIRSGQRAVWLAAHEAGLRMLRDVKVDETVESSPYHTAVGKALGVNVKCYV